MRKIVVDLNVLLDFFGRRSGHEEAAGVYDLCVRRKLKGFLCAHEITTLAYFLFKDLKDNSKVRTILTDVFDVFTTIPATESVLRDALDSSIADYEDAVIEVSALKHKVDCIVTGNLSDFRKGRVPPLTPSQFLVEYESSD